MSQYTCLHLFNSVCLAVTHYTIGVKKIILIVNYEIVCPNMMMPQIRPFICLCMPHCIFVIYTKRTHETV